MEHQLTDIYSSDEYDLLIYPTKTIAEHAACDNAARLSRVVRQNERSIDYWSERLSCSVRYIPVGERFLFLEPPSENLFMPPEHISAFVRSILSETGVLGFIVITKWLTFTEHKEEKQSNADNA